MAARQIILQQIEGETNRTSFSSIFFQIQNGNKEELILFIPKICGVALVDTH